MPNSVIQCCWMELFHNKSLNLAGVKNLKNNLMEAFQYFSTGFPFLLVSVI